ncbi:centractin- actin- protein of the dynactin complex [Bachmanniomyces sp. S44760]|nr:centractin- actin- protein of the dynactin complex [Bachmanniomyces sp. S44760]
MSSNFFGLHVLQVDYRLVMDDRWVWPAMNSEDFVGMISDPGFLGDPLVKTQHLLGATEWEKVSDTEVIGHHQLRAAHLRYTDSSMQRIDRRGHSHATNIHYYKKVDGDWKFAGLRPTVRWNEYDFEKIFKGLDFDDVAKKNAETPAATVAAAADGGVSVSNDQTEAAPIANGVPHSVERSSFSSQPTQPEPIAV